MTSQLAALEALASRTTRPIAFVCDLGLSGLGAAITLGRKGVPVVGVTHNPKAEGGYSRYCLRLIGPNPETEPEAYINFLVQAGAVLKTKAVLIPTGDVPAMVLCRMKSRLEPYFLSPVSDYSSLQILADKDRFKESLEQLGMPHPRTHLFDTPERLEQISKIVDYPCIVKPTHSSRFCAQYHVKVFVANSAKELLDACAVARKDNHEVVVQELIPGPDENMHLVHAYFNRKSEPLGIFTLRRIRQYPRGFGNGAMCEAIWIPALAKQVADYIKAIGYQGMIDAELKLDPRDGKFKFIEINPRPGWQTRLSSRCGVNVAYLAYLDAIGAECPKVDVSQYDGTKWLLMHPDIKSAFEGIRKGELTFWNYAKSFRGKIEPAIFAWDDPLPFLVVMARTLVAGVCKAFRLLSRAVSRLAASPSN